MANSRSGALQQEVAELGGSCNELLEQLAEMAMAEALPHGRYSVGCGSIGAERIPLKSHGIG